MTPLQSISTDPAASSDGRFHWDVLRLDALHPLVSGNKPFKLSGYLQAAADTGRRGILTFGGAWSNHIHAVAFAARERGLASIGIIRGEPADPLSATLQDAKAAGMQLRFLSRADYRTVRTFGTDDWQLAYPGFLMVPEGGAGVTGVRGAAEIMRLIPEGL